MKRFSKQEIIITTTIFLIVFMIVGFNLNLALRRAREGRAVPTRGGHAATPPRLGGRRGFAQRVREERATRAKAQAQAART